MLVGRSIQDRGPSAILQKMKGRHPRIAPSYHRRQRGESQASRQPQEPILMGSPSQRSSTSVFARSLALRPRAKRRQRWGTVVRQRPSHPACRAILVRQSPDLVRFEKLPSNIDPRRSEGSMQSLLDFCGILDSAGIFHFEWKWYAGRIELTDSSVRVGVLSHADLY